MQAMINKYKQAHANENKINKQKQMKTNIHNDKQL